jgi:hypothetical protein
MSLKRAAYITGNATGQIPQPSNGQFLKRNAGNYIWEQGGSSFSETLTISSNGQTSFTLNKSPVDGYADLYLNQLKLETDSYSLGGTGNQTVTYGGSYSIQTTDRLEARYLIANVPLTGGSGGTAETLLSPPLITDVSINNYSATDLNTATHVRLSSSSDTTITGFVNYGAITQRTLINVGSYNITLTNNDTSSTLGNRIKIPGGGSLVLEPDDAVTVFYDIVSAVWRVI